MHLLKFGELYEDDGRSIPESLRQEEGIEMAVEKMRQASASEQVREMIEFRRKAGNLSIRPGVNLPHL